MSKICYDQNKKADQYQKKLSSLTFLKIQSFAKCQCMYVLFDFQDKKDYFNRFMYSTFCSKEECT